MKRSARTCLKLGRETNLAISNIDCVKTVSVEHRIRVARGVLDDLIAEDNEFFPDMTTLHGDYMYIIIGTAPRRSHIVMHTHKNAARKTSQLFWAASLQKLHEGA